MESSELRIAVVGGTGVVGREVLSALFDRDVPSEHITVVGSERSEGVELEYGEDTLVVEKASDEAFRGVHLALFAAPAAVARKLAPRAQAEGALVVDASPAFRADGNVPLLLPGVNLEAHVAHLKSRLVAVPNATTSALALVLEPLRRAFGVPQAMVTALVSASGAGHVGVDTLEKQTAGLMGGREPEEGGTLFPHRIGFNLVPQVGDFLESSPWTAEEAGWTLESARLFAGRGEPTVVAGTAVQVPTFYGHGLSVHLRLKAPQPLERVRQALKGAPHLKLLDSPTERIYPMPMLVTADPAVQVGRLRAFPQAPEWVSLFAVVDNAGRGGALNLVETGLALATR